MVNDIFHNMFSCVKVRYTINRETSVFRDIQGSFYVLNWSISLKIVKLNPWMQQVAVRCQSKNIIWNCSMACQDTIRPAQPIPEACISSLCSLWYDVLFRLKGTDKIHTGGLLNFLSILISVLWLRILIYECTLFLADFEWAIKI